MIMISRIKKICKAANNFMKKRKNAIGVILLMLLLFFKESSAQQNYAFPEPNNIAGWEEHYQNTETKLLPLSETSKKQFQPNITERRFCDVPVLDIKPKNWKDNGRVIVYLHGGAYTLCSARSTLFGIIPVADRTGLRVISVDYTLAPKADCEQITGEVIAVLKELTKQNYSIKDIAVLGDSSGGGLAAGCILKMRDMGLGMPAALILRSPWVDISKNASYYNREYAKLTPIYVKFLRASADAYANLKDKKNPYLSPVYGDFSRGFPPTLIIGGDVDILCTDIIRLANMLNAAGQTVQLHIYKGMTHDFYGKDLPEAEDSLEKIDKFLN